VRGLTLIRKILLDFQNESDFLVTQGNAYSEGALTARGDGCHHGHQEDAKTETAHDPGNETIEHLLPSVDLTASIDFQQASVGLGQQSIVF